MHAFDILVAWQKKRLAPRGLSCGTISPNEVVVARNQRRGSFPRLMTRDRNHAVPHRTLRDGVLCVREQTFLFFLLIPLICFLAPNALAQAPVDDVHVTPRVEPPKVDPSAGIDPSLKTHTKPLKVDVNLVLVPVTITDPMNRLVTGLDKENFQLFEGKDVQEIRHFSSEDAPVSIGVIFDMSGSMVTKIERAREAVVEFFKTANPQDEFFMVAFADRPQEVSDFTSSVDDIQGKLVYTVPKGRTALLDAIYLGVSKMRQAKYTKKALLIISDGGDNHSRYTEGEIKSTVKEADVLIYAIGIYDHYMAHARRGFGAGSAGRSCGSDWRAIFHH